MVDCREKIGVSGVGGRPVQLASEDAELLDEDDSIDSFRCRCDAAKSCRGVRGDGWGCGICGLDLTCERLNVSACCLSGATKEVR